MLNDYYFKAQMKRMRAKFGKSLIDDEKVRLIFKAVQRLNPGDLQKIVDDFIGEDVRAKVSDFRNAARNFQSGYVNRCSLCGESGWIITNIEKIHDPIETLRCECTGGPPVETRLKAMILGLPLPGAPGCGLDGKRDVREIVGKATKQMPIQEKLFETEEPFL